MVMITVFLGTFSSVLYTGERTVTEEEGLRRELVGVDVSEIGKEET